MNYKKLYINLIETAKSKFYLTEQYTETHHILPRCKGGTDEKSNLVELTAREHFLAHWLLHKMYPKDFKLLAAWNMFCQHRADGRITSRLYEFARKAWVAKLHERKVTHPDWWHNWTKGNENSLWMNNGTKNARVKENEVDSFLKNGYTKGRITFKRARHSEEHKTKIAASHKKLHDSGWVSPNKGRKMESEEQIDAIERMIKTRQARGSFLSDEEREHRKKEKEVKIIVCNYCGKQGGKSIMKRWHFDKCKFKPVDGASELLETY